MVKHLKMNLGISYGQASDKGRKEKNDDCLGVRIPEDAELTTKGLVIAIADGVSAADNGKDAAEICVQNFLNDYYDTPDAWKVPTAGQKILNSLNSWLYTRSQSDEKSVNGYVTTFSLIIIKGRTGHIFHVGDTRISLIRKGEYKQLTRDHSSRLSSQSTYLTRAMGLDRHLEVDYQSLNVELEDIFVLSTDGVHEYLTPEVIQEEIDKPDISLDKVCEQLINRAQIEESPDNVSCQVFKIESLSEADSDEVYRELKDRPFPPPLAPGMTIEGFEIVNEIKASSRSQIYSVKHKTTGKEYVMKTPSVNYEDDRGYIERFIMEEWVARRVSSPNVVGIYQPDPTPHFLFHVFEYVKGPTVKDWVEKYSKKPDLEEVVSIVKDVIKGLRGFHRKEMLHQDLKPDNIVLSDKGAVIIDFGSCYIAGFEELSAPSVKDEILGTLHYAAPEYRLGYKPTNKSDMFSLAVIVYEMLTGSHPFGVPFEKASTEKEFAQLEYIPSYQKNPMVPMWLDGALQKALSVHPDDRYTSLSEFQQDLEHPNMDFLKTEPIGLRVTQSLNFWKCLTALLVVVEIVTILLLK